MPSAVTLPYTYKSVPSTLPPSVTVNSSGPEPPKYVISSSGHAAHPADIISSCRALQDHIKRSVEDAQKTVQDWENTIKERELAEKRRVAPGWLDREEKILQPTKAQGTKDEKIVGDMLGSLDDNNANPRVHSSKSSDREGEELDRAFGSLSTT